MTFLHIVIRRNSDGKIRTAHWNNWRPWGGEASEYWWSDGNMGCDCNRAKLFWEAAGSPVDEPHDRHECGDDAFSVLEITQDTDPTILYRDGDLE